MESSSKVTFLKSDNDKAPAHHSCHHEGGPGRGVAALFVTFRLTSEHLSGHQGDLLDLYHAILEQAVGLHHGDIVALSHEEALAVFTTYESPRRHVQDAVDAASSILNQVRERNRLRLAQDLAPLRLGIGLDAGVLAMSSCNRHPRLDPALQPYVNKARRLSDLNCQAPFPTFFVSHVVANGLDNGRHYSIQNLGNVFVENHTDPIVVYAVMQTESAQK